MAGFWTGLVHGTLMCAATLAALSLAFPRDAGEDRGPGADAAPAPVSPGKLSGPDARDQASSAMAGLPASGRAAGVEAADAPPPAAPSGMTAARPAPDLPRVGSGPGTQAAASGSLPEGEGGPQDARPALEPLPDPIGSDFRRGSDDPPRAPDASPAPAQGAAPRSLAVGTEAAPLPAAIPAEGPRVLIAPAAPAGIGLPAEPEPLDRPQMEAPVTPGQPGRVAGVAPDALPRPSRPEPAQPAAADEARDAPVALASPDAGNSRVSMPTEAAPADPPAAEDGGPAPEAPTEPAERPSEDPEGTGTRGTSAGPVPLEADPAPATGATAAAPLGTEAPQQPSGAQDDRPAQIGQQAALAADRSVSSTASADRAPRPAPDLTIPRAFALPRPSRAAPALPQPAAATPPAPDLSDLKPGASR